MGQAFSNLKEKAGKVQKSTWLQFFTFTGVVLLIWWIMEIFYVTLIGGKIYPFAQPRTGQGILGIFVCPFINPGWWTLVANTIGFPFMTWGIIYSQGVIVLCAVSGFVIIAGGFVTWLAAVYDTYNPPLLSAAASGWVWGLLFFLITVNIWLRNWKTLLISITIGVIYGLVVFLALRMVSVGNWIGFACYSGSGIVAAFLAGAYDRWQKVRAVRVAERSTSIPPQSLETRSPTSKFGSGRV